MVGAVPDKPLSPETKLWLREQLKKKGIKFAEPFQPKSETASSSAAPVTPDELDEEKGAIEAEKLRRLMVRRQTSAAQYRASQKRQKGTQKPTE
jgi:hypothetical protein